MILSRRWSCCRHRRSGAGAAATVADPGHLLVTNDFPPKRGGIQSYLWELWRRLPAGQATVLTTAYPEAAAFDAAQPFRIVRVKSKVLLASPALARRVRSLADATGAGLVLLDPALGVGLLGPWLERPFGVVVHGAEVTVPGRLPGARQALAAVLRQAAVVVAAGDYPATQAALVAGRALPGLIVVPPGVDAGRFRPLDAGDRERLRRLLGVVGAGALIVSVSRLVPRKGMDVLIEAASRLAPSRTGLTVLVGGGGRDRARLERLVARTRAPVRFLGPVADEDLAGLYGAADVFAMLCRDRRGGLEEGFGIVFLEAAACGVAQVAGASGGVADAVEHGRTGLLVDRPRDPAAVAAALAELVDDPARRAALGQAARQRAVDHFDYDRLAAHLATALALAVTR
ncbi:MAG: glycosyltransferase family 4 protein [Acidimicrobiales bacterium]